MKKPEKIIGGRLRRYSGRNVEQIRWTINMAAQEFDVDAHTVSKRVKAANITPNEDDNCYSTQQMVEALFGGGQEALRREQISDTKESALLKKDKRRILNRKYVDLELVEKVWSDWTRDLREKINQTNMSPEERSQLLGELKAVTIEAYYSEASEIEMEDEDEGTE